MASCWWPLKQSKTVKEFVQHHKFRHIKQHSTGSNKKKASHDIWFKDWFDYTILRSFNSSTFTSDLELLKFYTLICFSVKKHVAEICICLSTAVLHNSIFTEDTTEATNTSAMVFECTIFSITIVFTLKNHCIIGCIKVFKRLKILFCKYWNRCRRLRDWCGIKKRKKNSWWSLLTCRRSDEQDINLMWPKLYLFQIFSWIIFICRQICLPLLRHLKDMDWIIL